MPKEKYKFYVERSSFWVESAIIFMALSAVFRIIGCWGLWTDQYFATTQIALPVAANLLFILLIALLGKHAFWLTSLPVLMGVVFFILKALTFESQVQMALCIVLYVVVALLYTGTAFSLIQTKWLLVPLFLLPFLYHVFVEDVAKLRDVENPVTFAAGMQEMSVLCIMLALLFTAFALKKKDVTPAFNLPKMRAPKVISPAKPAEEALDEESEASTLTEEVSAEEALSEEASVEERQTEESNEE